MLQPEMEPEYNLNEFHTMQTKLTVETLLEFEMKEYLCFSKHAQSDTENDRYETINKLPQNKALAMQN